MKRRFIYAIGLAAVGCQRSGDSSLQGFATEISVNKGETVHFKVDTTVATFPALTGSAGRGLRRRRST